MPNLHAKDALRDCYAFIWARNSQLGDASTQLLVRSVDSSSASPARRSGSRAAALTPKRSYSRAASSAATARSRLTACSPSTTTSQTQRATGSCAPGRAGPRSAQYDKKMIPLFLFVNICEADFPTSSALIHPKVIIFNLVKSQHNALGIFPH